MSLQELRFLAKQAAQYDVIIEAGCYKGRSTRAMADNTNGIIHAIDPWDGEYEGCGDSRDDALLNYRRGDPKMIKMEFYCNLFDHIVNRKLIMHHGPFHEIEIKDANMIFIDANHNYETTKRDILHAISLLPHGGFLCGHDYRGEWPGVIRAVDEIFGVGIRLEDTIWYVNL